MALPHSFQPAKRGVPVYAKISGTGAGHSARRPYEGDGTPDLGMQAAIENALDKLDIQDQQQEEVLSRAVRVPFGSGRSGRV